jgi:hypothetical protein
MGLAFPKPRKIDRLNRKLKISSAEKAIDRIERRKCALRSQGRCEVIEAILKPESSAVIYRRCKNKASQCHHLLGGRGRRNVGVSMLAEHRLMCCAIHHAEITAHVLTPIPSPANPKRIGIATTAATVTYWRKA